MKLNQYVNIWIAFTIYLTFEFVALNYHPAWSTVNFLKNHLHTAYWQSFNISPEPGRQLSLILGWTGIAVMLAMNVYTLKKRIAFFQKHGPKLARTFDFHIFCGLLGPTFIVFHCNFKVHGLVAISFWSMVISAGSGVIGRYLYMRLLSKKQDLVKQADQFSVKAQEQFAKLRPDISQARVLQILKEAEHYAGLPRNFDEQRKLTVMEAFFGSIAGDIKSMFNMPNSSEGLPGRLRYSLHEYALARRQALALDPFQKLMGYWHAFHLPFAFFMYGAAIVHIIAALLFGVAK